MDLRASMLAAALLFSQSCLGDWEYQTVTGAGGVPLNVVTVGDSSSPAILFIHGIGQSHYSFVRQLNADLAEDFFLVGFDLRGHGASGKPWLAEAYTSEIWAQDVAAVMAASQIQRPIIVAWSFGTLVAMDYVRRFGVAHLPGMVFTGSLGALQPVADAHRRAQRCRREGVSASAQTATQSAIDRQHSGRQGNGSAAYGEAHT